MNSHTTYIHQSQELRIIREIIAAKLLPLCILLLAEDILQQTILAFVIILLGLLPQIGKVIWIIGFGELVF